MKTRNIGYWVLTSLTALAFAAGGAFDLSGAPPVLESMRVLGYPFYVASLLGVWKLLGAAAIVVPRLPRLKEWAYAGMLFDLTGAAVSHAAVGDATAKVVTPLVLLGVAMGSWALRPEDRVLARRHERSSAAVAAGRPALAA